MCALYLLTAGCIVTSTSGTWQYILQYCQCCVVCPGCAEPMCLLLSSLCNVLNICNLLLNNQQLSKCTNHCLIIRTSVEHNTHACTHAVYVRTYVHAQLLHLCLCKSYINLCNCEDVCPVSTCCALLVGVCQRRLSVIGHG